MSSAGLVIERFAAVSGFLPSTLDRMLRPMRARDQVPIGEPGRGQHRGQYERSHLANVLFAFGALQPSESAEVARIMRGWRYGWTEPQDELPRTPMFRGETLGDVVEEMIDGVAQTLSARANGASTAEKGAVPLPDSMLFAPNTQSAELWWPRPGKRPRIDRYVGRGIEGDLRDAPASMTRNAVRRQTFIHQCMIVTAGELWADTQARRAGDAATLDFLDGRRKRDDQR